MIKVPLIALGVVLFAFPSAAVAGEIFGGVYKHNVDTPLSLGDGLEGGVDLQFGVRGGNIIRGTKLRPHLFGALNSKGDTNYAAAGLSWKFGERYYVRPGVGIAIHDGATDKFNRTDRIAFGSRVLAELELGVGARIGGRSSIEASWIHISHAQLFGGQNPGMDNIGTRLNFNF